MRRSIVNDPDQLVPQALEGLVLSHPQLLELEAEHRYVRRREPAQDKVGLVSGGGSGHEPLHAGMVGRGMLDVAVAGAVFTSPTALQVLEATRAADSGRGVVQIVKNYTGDVLNFRIAGEISGDDQVETEIVLVDDDLATAGNRHGASGRNGCFDRGGRAGIGGGGIRSGGSRTGRLCGRVSGGRCGVGGGRRVGCRLGKRARSHERQGCSRAKKLLDQHGDRPFGFFWCARRCLRHRGHNHLIARRFHAHEKRAPEGALDVC